jgi:hypothetical protein
MTSALFTGAWLDPRTLFVFDRVTRKGDTLVVEARNNDTTNPRPGSPESRRWDVLRRGATILFLAVGII